MLVLAWIGLISAALIAGIAIAVFFAVLFADANDNPSGIIFSLIFGPVSLIIGYVIWYNVIKNYSDLLKLIWIPVI